MTTNSNLGIIVLYLSTSGSLGLDHPNSLGLEMPIHYNERRTKQIDTLCLVEDATTVNKRIDFLFGNKPGIEESLFRFAQNLSDESINIEPEIQAIISKRFWDML